MEGNDNSGIKVFGRPIHRAWLILAGCCFLQAGGLGNIILSMGVYYVPICNELGFARSEISLWQTAYFLATIPAMPIASELLTRFNVRTPMTASIVVIALNIGLMSQYTQLWQWVVSGAIVGSFGACVLVLPSTLMIGNWFAGKVGIAMGISACASALSAAILSPVYSWIIGAFGWRVSYVVEALIFAAFCLPWALTVFRLRPQDIGAEPYGYEAHIDRNIAHAPAGALDDAGEVRSVPFRKAVCSASFTLLFVFACCAALIGAGYDSHIPGIAASYGFDAAYGALLLSVLQLGSCTDKLLMGLLNDLIGVRKTVTIELCLVVCGLLGMCVVRHPVFLAVSVFVFGVQNSLVSVSLPLLVRQLFGISNYARLYAWVRVGVGIFGSFGAALVGLSFDALGSFAPAFLGGIAVALTGLAAVTGAYALRGRLCDGDEG